jgi:transposase
MAYPKEFQKEVADAFIRSSKNLQEVADMFNTCRTSVRRWAKRLYPNEYHLATNKSRSLLMAQEIVEARPNIRVGELAELVDVSWSSVDRWIKQGLIELDIQCDICGEPTRTKYCTSCVEKDWPRRQRLYGLSLDELRAMPTQCEICGSTDRLSVDHNHNTGTYRGVLCSNCNVGLGHLQEKIGIFIKAIIYLITRNK